MTIKKIVLLFVALCLALTCDAQVFGVKIDDTYEKVYVNLNKHFKHAPTIINIKGKRKELNYKIIRYNNILWSNVRFKFDNNYRLIDIVFTKEQDANNPLIKLIEIKDKLKEQTNAISGYKKILVANDDGFDNFCFTFDSYSIYGLIKNKNKVYLQYGFSKEIYDTQLYDVVEQMPMFPGGYNALLEYLKENVIYPETAKNKGIQGRVVVSFIVEKDGSISDAKAINTIDEDLVSEAIRVITTMPKWIPGKQDGRIVRVKYCVPVSFRLH